MPSPAAPTARRSAALDGLRGLAALAVLLFHSEVTGLAGGLLGVDLFFVLSGFLITRLLLDEHERRGSVRLGRFWARRTVRLWPPLAAMLIVGLLAARRLSPDGTLHGYLREAFSAGTWSMNVVASRNPTIGHPLGHTWTLAMEEQFYLLWPPVLILLLLRTRLRRHVVPLLLAAAAGSWVLLNVLWKDTSFLPAAYVRPDTRALPLLIGCTLAFTVRSAGQRWRAVIGSPWFGGAALVALVATVTLIGRNGTTLRFLVTAGTVAISAAGYGLIAHTEVARNGWVARVLGARPLAAIGTMSYSVYLIQNPLLRVVEHNGHLTGTDVRDVLARIALCLAAGALLWATVERPLRPVLARLGATVPPPHTTAPEADPAPPSAARRRRHRPLLTGLGALGAVPVLFVAAGTAAGLRWTRPPAPAVPSGNLSPPARPGTAGSTPAGGGSTAGSTGSTRSTPVNPAGPVAAATGPVRSGAPDASGGSTGVPITIPSLPVSLPTLPVTVPTLPVTVPTLPVTVPTLPVTVPSSLPVTVPSSLPVTVPSSLPVTVPSSLPVTVPPAPRVQVPTPPLAGSSLPRVTLPTSPPPSARR